MNTIQLIAVCIGGACGSGLRYIINQQVSEICHGQSLACFVATLVVNVLGCLFFVVVLMLPIKPLLTYEWLKFALLTGFCGGLTTFSTFSYENWQFWSSGEWGNLALNVVANVALCLFTFIIGATIFSHPIK